METRADDPVFIENPDDLPSEAVPDNFVSYTLRHQAARPPITWKNWYRELDWLGVFVLCAPNILGLIGACYTPLTSKTAIWFLLYAHFTGIGLSAGYHRLWSHRTYKATRTLEYILAILGAGAFHRSIIWWTRVHRAHHRYTDTDLDPCDVRKGLFHSHIGWVILKPRYKPGPVDISDLQSNPVVKWQYEYYPLLVFVIGIVVPTSVAGFGWGDWQGGFVWASLLRIAFVQHCDLFLNSLSHWFGRRPYDDKLTPTDSFLVALLTAGEGYHNFHHQFPMDYRTGYKWYHYDPTKWFIWGCEKLGFAAHLKRCADNEIQKGKLTMKLKRLRQTQDALLWPSDKSDLPILTWEDYQRQAESRSLIAIAGYIHDVSGFFDGHPGGPHLLKKNIGQDATAAFFGGVYDHSNAAHNILAMKRVAILLGGMPHGSEEHIVPPSQRLRVTRHDESST